MAQAELRDQNDSSRPAPGLAWVREYFRLFDEGDVDRFSKYLAEDVTFRVANNEPIRGRTEVSAFFRSLLTKLAGVSHEIHDVWGSGDNIALHGTTTFKRKDGTSLTVNFADMWKMRGDKIVQYFVFIDKHML